MAELESITGPHNKIDGISTENDDQEIKTKTKRKPPVIESDGEEDVGTIKENESKKRKLSDDAEAKEARNKKENEEGEGSEIYCICRTSDIDRFMIACDKCGEWFHGDCVKVKKKAAKKIEIWYCPNCKKLNASLETVYKEKKEKTKQFTKASDNSSELEYDFDPISKQKRSSKQCGKCDACARKVDCASCTYCKDMRKYGGPGKLRKKCKRRQCHNQPKARKKDKPDHPVSTTLNTIDEREELDQSDKR